MPRMYLVGLFSFACLTLVACSDPDPSKDTSADMSVVVDMPDLGSDLAKDSAKDLSVDQPTDTSADLGDMAKDLGGDIGPDMPRADMGGSLPLAGFGSLMGMCDEIDDELTDPTGSVIQNNINFGNDPYDMGDFMSLSMGGQEIITDGNAGGSSVLSEVFAYEVLYRCELAVLIKTETEVKYSDPNSKITDMLVEIDGKKVGVSVTRAVKFPRDDNTQYSVEQAKDLLDKKLKGILDSSMNVVPEDKWVKQILHVLAYDEQHATALRDAYGQLEADVKADTVVWITVTDGMDEFIY